jgi:tripartite-type tricarboxylate transporter receptor subunit TctC
MGERLVRMVAATAVAAAAIAAAAAATAAAAQSSLAADGGDFPSRTIRIVVPFPPGGPTDVLTRMIGQRLSERWGQAVVIENRPGANTAIGAQAVARSAPDGYTLLAAMDTTMVMAPLTTANLPYDPFRDFAPIALLARNMSVLVVRADDGPDSVKQLIERARARPGKLNMGAGTLTSRLGALAFAKTAAIDVLLIPYKGSADIVQGLLSGSVDFAFDSTASSLPQIEAGRFRALAKYSDRPFPALPDLPSLATAADLPSLEESSTWIGLVAPAGTPAAIIDKVRRAVADIYADRAVGEKFTKAGLFAVTSTPAEFNAFMHRETERWSKVLKEAGGLTLE